ncbi:hypothetical protein QOT17_000180 [Balamuthia mandrillaris]
MEEQSHHSAQVAAAEPNGGIDPCASLSPEVCIHLFAFLSAPELLKCSLVSRRWHALTNDFLLWKLLCERTFHVSRLHPKFDSWKQFFKHRYPLLQQIGKQHLNTKKISTDLVHVHKDRLTISYVGTAKGDQTFGISF